jgi:TldD protein
MRSRVLWNPRRRRRLGAGSLLLFSAAAILLSQSGAPYSPGPNSLPPMALAQVPSDDALLRAMHDEMDRSRQLRVASSGDVPYYFSYSVTDGDNLTVSASLGAVYNVSRNQFRAPAIEVRVGSYEFDHTGHVFSGIYQGSRYDQSWPIDNNYANLRQSFWLATDVAYKAALESMSRKRASLKNAAAQTEALPDFSTSPPVVSIAKITPVRIDQQALAQRTAKISAVFNAYPEALTSALELHYMGDTTYLVNSEGTALRYPDNLGWVYGKAEGQAPDGMLVHDAATFQSNDPAKLPSDAELQAGFTAVAENIRALVKAPAGEAYTGPVLFEPQAAAQLLAQLIGDNLRVPRRPLADPGRPVNYQPSEFEGRMGARVLPEWIDVTDDSTQTTWNGKPLVGTFEFDIEGVPPKPVSIVQKGVLRSFLTTRQPVRGFPSSNGHARLGGSYGARSAAIGNMFVKARETAPLAALRQRLISMLGERNKPYGMIVRKLDYPFAGSGAELQALASATAQGGGGRLVSPPILVYRVYPDGREQLVRGLRFRGVSARTLRDVLAASSESALFEYVNNAAPLAMLGAGGYLAGTSVVAPAMLFDEIEFEPPREQLPRAPIVPPPSLAGR